MNPEDNAPLFSEFPPVGREEWEAQIAKDLDGADYEKKLVWRTLEGFPVQPYYVREDLEQTRYLGDIPGVFPFTRGSREQGNAWKIRQDIRVTDPEKTRLKATEALRRGAEAIGFVFDRAWEARGTSPGEWINGLLEGIDPREVPVHFIDCPFAESLPTHLAQWCGEKNLKTSIFQGSAGIDPFADMLCSGAEPGPALEQLADLLAGNLEGWPAFRLLGVNTAAIHNAGATLVQELAFGLAMGNDYLAAFAEKGIRPADLARTMQFTLSTGSNYFLEIAKLRAARYLWSRILEAWGVETGPEQAMCLHSVTSRYNKTRFDPYVNMLRSTTEAMSSVLGGADSLSVEPFDAAFREPSDFSERIARNTQIILKEEAYFDKVADPAAGSYYIEMLTDSMVAASWDLFLEVEKKGGFLAAFREGWIQEKVEEAAARRDQNLALRKDILVGTNQYPNMQELSTDPATASAGTTVQPGPLKPLVPSRAAVALEEIRLRTERSGKRPKVLLFTFGNLTMRRARASFATGFFACAGFEVIDHPGFSSLDEGISASIEQEAGITVICSSDEEYPQIASYIFDRLKDKSILVVAGYPKDSKIGRASCRGRG